MLFSTKKQLMANITTVAIYPPCCLRAVVLMVAVLVMWPDLSTSLEQTEVGIVRKTAQSDLIFTGGLLWKTSSCPSMLCCAVTCVSDERCVCFTVTKATATGR